MTAKASAAGKGYLETAVGSLVGGVLGAVGGFVLGILYVETFMPYAGLEGLMPPLFAALAGVVLGIGLGVWGGLRLRRHPGAGITGLAGSFPAAGVAVAVLWAVEVGLDAYTGRNASQWLAPTCATVAAILTVVAVRAAVVGLRGADWDEPPRSS